MRALSQIQLVPLLDGALSREYPFQLYCSLLRDYVELAFGWDLEFQKQRFIREYPTDKIQVIDVDLSPAGMHKWTTEGSR